MIGKKATATVLAILAAVLYAISIPCSKQLLTQMPPIFMAGLLYLGAGLGVSVLYLFKKDRQADSKLTKKELPYTVGMIVLDILAPIFLLIGLATTNPSSASLLNSFEIVATSLIALVIFKEKISFKLWVAIGLIICSSILLSVDDLAGFELQPGALFILLACVCWGFENNCTRALSAKNTHQIVMLKGVFSGLGSIVTALVLGETVPMIGLIATTLLLGFVSYGLSIFVYIRAQHTLGAAKTSAYYALAPFIGVLLSFVLFGTTIRVNFIVALLVMVLATVIIVLDTFLQTQKIAHSHLALRRVDGKLTFETLHHEHDCNQTLHFHRPVNMG